MQIGCAAAGVAAAVAVLPPSPPTSPPEFSGGIGERLGFRFAVGRSVRFGESSVCEALRKRRTERSAENRKTTGKPLRRRAFSKFSNTLSFTPKCLRLFRGFFECTHYSTLYAQWYWLANSSCRNNNNAIR